MFANGYRSRFFSPKFSKDLRTLAIKALPELDVRRDRLRPPITFDVSVFSNVAHDFRLGRQVAALKRQPVHGLKRQVAILRGKSSSGIKFRVNPATDQEVRAAPLFDDASVVEHDDLIKVVNGRETVRGDQRCATAH